MKNRFAGDSKKQKAVPELEVDMAVLWGDGIGTKEYLGKHLQTLIDGLHDRYQIAVNIEDIDISERERLSWECVWTYYIDIAQRIREKGRALKMPTTTFTDKEIEERHRVFEKEESFPPFEERFKGHKGSIADFMRGQMESPNDHLRKRLHFTDIIRPFYAKEGLFSPLGKIGEFTVFDPEEWRGVYTPMNGQYQRRLDKSILQRYIIGLLDEAKRTKKNIVIASKHTISPLDRVFSERIEKEAQDAGVNVQKRLFDSFLPELVRGDHVNALIACPPDYTGILATLYRARGKEVEEKTERSFPIDRTIHRIAIGSGYGETFEEDDNALWETYTLPEEELSDAFEKALNDAQNRKCSVTVVLPGKCHPVSVAMQRLIEELRDEADVMGDIPQVEYTSFGTLAVKLVMNPLSPKYQVLLMPNNLGDFLSDLLPQIYYGKIRPKPAVLGVPEGYVHVGETEEGHPELVFADPSTGTAPALANPSMRDKIVPAGMILAFSHILEDPRLDPVVNHVGSDIRRAVIELLAENSTRESYAGFSELVLDRVQQISKESRKKKRRAVFPLPLKGEG